MERLGKIMIVLIVLVAGGIILARIITPVTSDVAVVSYASSAQGVGVPVDDSGEGSGGISVKHPVGEEEYNALRAKYQFRSDLYPYFASLDEEEQKAYYFYYDCAYNAKKDVYWGNYVLIDRSDIMKVVNSVYCDHPELFWMEAGVLYSYHQSTGRVSSIQPEYNDLVNDLDNAKALFSAKAEEILADANLVPGHDTVQMEAVVHDRLSEICEYDLDASNHQSAYSCMVEGRSVCSGYSRAFQFLMQRLGVPTYYVTGQALITREYAPHGWNIVVIDGQSYNVDVTWDDDLGRQFGEPVHAFFNVPDSAISETHSRDSSSAFLPSCTADDLTYDKTIGNTIMISEISWRN